MMVLGPSHWHVNKHVLHSTYLLQIRLLFRLGQELLMCFPGNQIARILRSAGSSTPVKLDAHGRQRALSECCVVPVSSQSALEMAITTAYLCVNNVKPSFAFSSMSSTPVTGSSNLARQVNANVNAASHWPVDLRLGYR